jgi:hypothetical protein
MQRLIILKATELCKKGESKLFLSSGKSPGENPTNEVIRNLLWLATLVGGEKY